VQNTKEFWTATVGLIVALLSWVLFTPLSFLLPKYFSRVIVIGRDNGIFTDNSKHFFLYLVQQPSCDCTFLTMNAACYRLLNERKLPVIWHPSFRSYWYLLTAQFLVIDSAEWVRYGIYQAGINSRLIQLWHGAPLKQIEIPLYLKRKAKLPWFAGLILSLQKAMTGRYPKFDMVVSTSPFFSEEAFSKAFNSRLFIESGYPRNDAMLEGCKFTKSVNTLVWIHTDRVAVETIQEARRRGHKIVLYAPTFRKNMKNPFLPSVFNLKAFSAFAKTQGLLVVMKLHPTMVGKELHFNESNLFFYDAVSDIYPSLPLFDCLITDYSSLYFDFLLLDKPILFYCYDLEEYKNQDRQLLFEFEAMTPGPKCVDQSDLESAIKKILIQSKDDYAAERKRVCDLVFKYKDSQSSKRIWRCMTQGIIP